MTEALATQRDAIAAPCRRFHVRGLDVFGSAARAADFDPARSGIDRLVDDEPGHAAPAFAEFLALRDALEALLGRRVDLAMASAIRNPWSNIRSDRISQTGSPALER